MKYFIVILYWDNGGLYHGSKSFIIKAESILYAESKVLESLPWAKTIPHYFRSKEVINDVEEVK